MRSGRGANLADFEQELETIRTSNSAPWQVFDALGDINRDRRDYEVAALLPAGAGGCRQRGADAGLDGSG
ncbi:hypothetical protein LP421_09470 [Rhizobium sp. RCAM05350]|nr:hypothetical protein LP421_09470 [Rhizobium sp. RCAM05350]